MIVYMTSSRGNHPFLIFDTRSTGKNTARGNFVFGTGPYRDLLLRLV